MLIGEPGSGWRATFDVYSGHRIMVGRPNHASRNLSSVAYLPSRAVSRMHAIITMEDDGVSQSATHVAPPHHLTQGVASWSPKFKLPLTELPSIIGLSYAYKSNKPNLASGRLCVVTYAARRSSATRAHRYSVLWNGTKISKKLGQGEYPLILGL